MFHQISLQLKWSRSCILLAGTAVNQNPRFQTNDIKIYVPVVNLPAQNNIKLFKQLEQLKIN